MLFDIWIALDVLILKHILILQLDWILIQKIKFLNFF